MAILQTLITNSFREWMVNTNTTLTNIGDWNTLTYVVAPDTNIGPDVVSSLNILNSSKFNKVGGTITGAVTMGSSLIVTGATTHTGLVTFNGNITLGTNVVTINSTTGNTAIAGTLGVAGSSTLASVSATTLALSGLATIGSTLNVVGDFSVATNKFNVTALTGNTAIAGTLGVTGATTLNSTLAVTSDLAIATNKFNVTALTGNTAIAGTLNVTGATTLVSPVTVNGGTITVSAPMVNLNQTWNNAGTTFNGIVTNITNTASNVASLIADFKVNGISQLSIGVGGTLKQYPINSLAREIIVNLTELRKMREYQDLYDSNVASPGVQGLDPYSVTNWSMGFNAVWNSGTSTYVRDRTLAGDHSGMVRYTEDIGGGGFGSGWSQQWLIAPNVAGGVPISWVKRAQFDLLNDSYSLGTTNPLLTGTSAIFNGAANSELPISGNTSVFNLNVVGNIVVGSNVTIGSTTTFAEYIVTTATIASTTLASIPVATWRSATFQIQAYDSTVGKYHMVTVTAIHDAPFGTSVDSVEYGAVATAGVCGSYSVAYVSGNMVLSVIPSSVDSTIFKVFSSLQAI